MRFGTNQYPATWAAPWKRLEDEESPFRTHHLKMIHDPTLLWGTLFVVAMRLYDRVHGVKGSRRRQERWPLGIPQWNVWKWRRSHRMSAWASPAEIREKYEKWSRHRWHDKNRREREKEILKDDLKIRSHRMQWKLKVSRISRFFDTFICRSQVDAMCLNKVLENYWSYRPLARLLLLEDSWCRGF